MQYKPYGKTGKSVSVIGYGGMRFRKSGDAWDLDACADLVRLAHEKGVTYFDTAPGYCEDKSEEIMGRAFKGMGGEYHVSTKSSEKTGDGLRRQLERSLARLGKPRITFFHIWCVLTLDDYRVRMAKGGPYEAAMKAKAEGLIEHVVFSTHCTGEEIAEIVESGGYDGVTVGYNIINFPFRQKGLEAAHAHGLGVATMNPLGGGMIPQNADYFDFIRGEGDASVVEAAIRFNAAHPEISTVLCGMGTREEVLSNTAIGDTLRENRPEAVAAIRSRIGASLNELCTGCRYCEYCPQDIEVSKFMQAYNKKIIQNPQAAMNEMKWHWRIPRDKAEACIACGECETRCTQHLPIIERLKEMAEWHEAT